MIRHGARSDEPQSLGARAGCPLADGGGARAQRGSPLQKRADRNFVELAALVLSEMVQELPAQFLAAQLGALLQEDQDGELDDAARSEHATMPVENFKTFMDNPVAGKAEPPKAQEIYKVLDNVMSGVLTNKDADVDKLLSTAESQVNQILANQ